MNYEKLFELIISKIFLIIVIFIIVTGVVIVSAINSIPQSAQNVDINSPYDQTERRSPFTVRENTLEMWGDDSDNDYYYD